MKKTPIALMLLLLAALVAASAGGASEGLEPTPTSVDIYGASVGFSLTPGDIVAARTAAGLLCGSCVVTTPGFYGLLHVYGDDPTTPGRDGALSGELLLLEVNGEPVSPEGAAPVWTRDGDRQRVNIAR